ncbi:hypothetical protein [Asaia bogorensis]|uniref:Uncharacterized protein n=1 Tax=Asaia bogorensis NBRC 16594 TaxID=1231624 RepID=A0AAN4U1U2_9PROT|nr:hypothetical protein [Asaia bogorensis]BAT20082.1 hypothetical protein Asbog_01821 [Asaia bogorensis NBRC 16594]GBQ80480.1 hypothetical protein AA0311_2370 [Asaia bogorensis NBRC 16594]GEL52498.1 hypothetical protein ABO01nite_05050 [Asaia bogorensis NBRC 16594]
MSRLDICLILLAIGLWSSIYVIKFKEDIQRWYHIRFDKSPPPAPRDGKMPEVQLPFRYDLPMTDKDEDEYLRAKEQEEAQEAEAGSPIGAAAPESATDEAARHKA